MSRYSGYNHVDDEDIDDEAEELRSETLPSSEDGEDGRVQQGGKRERLRSVLLPAIQSRVTALGGFEDVVPEFDDEHTVKAYRLGDEALGCLKDLKRFWKLDDTDEERTIARIFFEAGLLKNDLVHIVNAAGKPGASTRQEKAALASADLMSAMTWPISPIEELRDAELQGGKSGLEALSKVDYSGLIAIQRVYKSVILKSGVVGTLCAMLVPRLQKGPRERTERDENVISLILHIFRNLAYIKDRTVSSHHSAEAIEESTLQSEFICQLASENVFDMLITIASLSHQSQYNQWNILCLEVFFLIFRCVERADLLVKKSEDVGKVMRVEKLSKLLDAEASRKKLNGRRGATRHSRFGTTVTIESGKDRVVLHKQAAVAMAHINPGQILDMGRRKKAKTVKRENDLAAPADLTPEAISILQAVAMSFVESAFNPFFGSVLKDIRMQRQKVREADHAKYLFLVRFFLEYFLALLAWEKSRNIDPESDDGHDFNLVAEMTEHASLLYVCMRMQSAMEMKPILWTDLHAAVDCYTQLLLVIDALASSNNEVYQEVAENLQSKLYYQGETLDILLVVIKNYKDQSLSYLGAIVNMAYVKLRMLEKYSKNRDHMYIKKKAGRGRKGGDGNDDEAERENITKYKESGFEFSKFERRFSSTHCIATYLRYLSGYKDFTDDEQMKRVVKLLYRAAVNAKGEGMFFKATTLELFRRILDDRAYLPRTPAYGDLAKLITYILKTFFKVAKEEPMLLIETFFTNRYNDALKAVHGAEDSDNDDDEPKPLKLSADLIFKRNVEKSYSWSEQVKIAVSILNEKNRDDLIEWVKANLAKVAKERDAVLAEVDANRQEEIDALQAESDEDDDAFAMRKMRMLTGGPSDAAKEALQAHDVAYADEAIEKEATKNRELRLLLKLLHWEFQESASGLIWTVPASRLPSELRGDIRIIDDALLDPLDAENSKGFQAMVTTKAKSRRVRAASSDDNSDDDEDDGVVFSDPEVAAAVAGEKARKKKQKRKLRKSKSAEGLNEDNEMEATQGGTRRRRAAAEHKAYHTSEFIVDSDDDPEADRAFFEKEAARRAAMEAGTAHLIPAASQPKKKGRKKAGRNQKKQGSQLPSGDSDQEDGGDKVAVTTGASDSDTLQPTRKASQLAKPRQRMKKSDKESKNAGTKRKARVPTPQAEDSEQSSEPSGSSRIVKRSRPAASSDAGDGSDIENASRLDDVSSKRKAGRVVVDSEDDD